MASERDPSLECTWEKLSKQLAQCEYLTQAAALKGNERVAKEEQRMLQVREKRLEIEAEHQKAVDVLKRELDGGMRGIVNKSQMEIAEAKALKEKAEADLQEVTRQADLSERHSQVLEREVKRLYRLLDRLDKEYDTRRTEMMEAVNNDVAVKMDEHDREVKEVALFAFEVQEDAFTSIERMQDEARNSSNIAVASAESRSRYEKLYQLASTRATDGISEKRFQEDKRKIMTEWWTDWQGNVDKLSPGPPSLAQICCSRPETPMKPSSPNRPRSVQVARDKAMAKMLNSSGPTALPMVVENERPKTAP